MGLWCTIIGAGPGIGGRARWPRMLAGSVNHARRGAAGFISRTGNVRTLRAAVGEALLRHPPADRPPDDHQAARPGPDGVDETNPPPVPLPMTTNSPTQR